MANKKILIVEDDIMLLEIMKLQVEEQGCTAVTAENGKDGLFKAMAEKPDLILADIMMPELNGIEMIKMIKQDNNLKDIPIVVISALGREKDIEDARAVGAVDYMIKPFLSADLEKMFKKHLS
jgi:two-component system alkaline phosphatase synthesis response regulator PhoP